MTNWDAVRTGSLDALGAAILDRTSDQRDDPSSREQEYADACLALIERCKATESAVASLRERAEAGEREAAYQASQWQPEHARAEAAEQDAQRLREALAAMLRRDERNTCRHEETHRGGVLWTICDSCGARWADDEGGKPDWKEPEEWIAAERALAGERTGIKEG